MYNTNEQTRYYDPEIARFISPDSTKYLDPESIHGLNLYAYCLNNPVMNVDPSGNLVLSTIALSALGAFFLGGLTSVVSQGVQYGWDNISVEHAIVDGLFAAGSVLLAATPISLLGSVALGSTMGIGQYLVASAFHEDAEITLSGVIAAGLLGGIGGAFSGAGANNIKSLSPKENLSSFTKGAVRKVLRKIDKYGLNSKQFRYAMNKYGFAAMREINTLISKSFYRGVAKIAVTIPISAALSSHTSSFISNIINFFE